MLSRPYILFVAVFWLAAMSWLTIAKLIPPLIHGDAPRYQQEIGASGEQPRRVGWALYWNDRKIGVTVVEARHPDDSAAEMRAIARIENLTVSRVVRDVLGDWTWLTGAGRGRGEDVEIEWTIATKAMFDEMNQLDRFETAIKTVDGVDLLFVRGAVIEAGKLRLDVRQGDGSPLPLALSPFGRDIPLPPDAEITSSLAPRSRLVGLRVGQRWTTPLVNPLAPTAAVDVIEGRVESREPYEWSPNRPLSLVVFRRDASEGAREGSAIVGRMWIDDEGEIQRQEATLGGISLRMDRLSDEELAGPGQALDSPGFERLTTPMRYGPPPGEPPLRDARSVTPPQEPTSRTGTP